jgi:hypothetical protein
MAPGDGDLSVATIDVQILKKVRGGAAGVCAGFTLLEVSIAGGVLMFGVLLFSRTIAGGLGSHRGVRERSLALSAIESTLERLRTEAFGSLFRTYNQTPADDPGGFGSAPGSDFDVPGLDPLPDDPDGQVGEILFPVEPGNVGVLREDLPLPRFGTPFDLDHDGDIAGDNVAGSYRLLPVLVRLSWRGQDGPQRAEVATWLCER